MNNKPVENGELRELLKGEMFAAIEYGRLNSDVTQDAVEASWFHHLDDIMEYVDDHVAQEKAKARIDELKRLREFWGESNDPTLGGEFKFISLCDLDKRLIFLKEGLNDE